MTASNDGLHVLFGTPFPVECAGRMLYVVSSCLVLPCLSDVQGWCCVVSSSLVRSFLSSVRYIVLFGTPVPVNCMLYLPVSYVRSCQVCVISSCLVRPFLSSVCCIVQFGTPVLIGCAGLMLCCIVLFGTPVPVKCMLYRPVSYVRSCRVCVVSSCLVRLFLSSVWCIILLCIRCAV
jgi:hypothetical protein